MKARLSVALVVVAMVLIAAVGAGDWLLSLSDVSYDTDSHLWDYTYVVDNRTGPASVFDLMLTPVADASVTRAPQDWTTFEFDSGSGADRAVIWSTGDPSDPYDPGPWAVVPVGQLSTGALTGSFVISSPHPRGTNTVAYYFNESGTPSGLVDGPSATPEPRAVGVVLAGAIGALALGRRRRRGIR